MQVLKEFEDIKGVIRSRQSKMDRQHNGQTEKDKRTKQKIEQLRTMGELRYSEGQGRVVPVTNPVISNE